MSTSVSERSGLERWAGLGGIAYVALFIGGAIVAFSGEPDTSDAPAKLISYYSDSGHRDKEGIGWALVLLGVFFFLWFVAALRQFVRRIDDDGVLTTLVTIGGAIYAALSLTGFSLGVAVKTMSDDTFRHQVYPGLIHAADDAAYVIHSAGGIGAGAMIIAASVATRRAALIPGWAGWLSVIVGILALGSIFFFPQGLIAIWLIVASWLLFRATPAGPQLRGAG